MTLLVADVGGTNTRIALVRDDGQIVQLQSFENDDFASFEMVLARYGDQRDLPRLTGACMAIAGPVTAGVASLANRDWRFEKTAIVAALSLAATTDVFLVNDLMALGFALPHLTPSQTTSVRVSMQTKPLNSQMLVVGVGTGFNACVVNFDQDTPVVNGAELGRASLPQSVYQILQNELGPEAAIFTSNEHLFSGDGLSRLFRLVSGGQDRKGPQILDAYDPQRNDATSRTVDLFAQALGVATKELAFQYLPYGGIHFAGGVARGVLGSPARLVFLRALNAPGPFDEYTALVSIRMITDDAAALRGAAQFAMGKITSR